MGLRPDFIPDVVRYEQGEKKGQPKLGGDGLPFLDPDSEFYILEELEHVVRQRRRDPDVVSVCGFDAHCRPDHLEIVVQGLEMYFRLGDPPERKAFSDTLTVRGDDRCQLSEKVISAVGLIGQFKALR